MLCGAWVRVRGWREAGKVKGEGRRGGERGYGGSVARPGREVHMWVRGCFDSGSNVGELQLVQCSLSL